MPVRRHSLRTLLLAAAVLSAPLVAQQGAVQFKHFHQYPATGQWTTEGQSTVNGRHGTAPSQTTCASPVSASTAAAIKQFGNNVAPTCKISILRDEPTVAESRQVCTFGPSTQTIDTTLKAVDDRTLTVDVHSTNGQQDLLMQSTSHYMGACTTAQTAAAASAPSLLKPNAETCARLPKMREDTLGALTSCKQMPAAYQADCTARVQGSLRMVTMMEQGCK